MNVSGEASSYPLTMPIADMIDAASQCPLQRFAMP